MSDKTTYNVIGLMSGTSIDGLDIAHVQFIKNDSHKFSSEIKNSETIAYSKDLRSKLLKSIDLNGEELSFLNREFGQFCGNAVNLFLETNNTASEEIDIIASHGHTVFHQPNKGLTLQIGCGQSIASITNIKTINDFRNKDVILGGQGAPLVPIGDHTILKGKADSYLNLGGFSNISMKKDKIIAFDICPVGVVLNQITQTKFNTEYDKNGDIGSRCSINESILSELNELPYYSTKLPKSLGIENLDDFWSILKQENNPEKQLGTSYMHIAYQIAKSLNEYGCKSVYVTGGGAKNQYLIKLIQQFFKGRIIIPNENMVDFKEALIFAYLGLLRRLNKTNILAEVTGATSNSSSGVIYLP